MAHGAFKVLDSDTHIIEPPDRWPRGWGVVDIKAVWRRPGPRVRFS